MFIFLTMSRKWVVSLMYDFISLTNGLRKKSTNSEILSVGHSLAETMGLPGGGMPL